jgi:putative endonuclease
MLNEVKHRDVYPSQRTQMTKQYYIYILSNASRRIYVGVTNNLERRVYEHKHKLLPGFTSKYNITRLVHFEITSNVLAAIAREKQIKGWLRSKKLALIDSQNPTWEDLSKEWFDGATT